MRRRGTAGLMLRRVGRKDRGEVMAIKSVGEGNGKAGIERVNEAGNGRREGGRRGWAEFVCGLRWRRNRKFRGLEPQGRVKHHRRGTTTQS